MRIRWRPVLRESVQFLFFENGYRLLQRKTRDDLGGPFFHDWGDSVKGIRGWNDGDPIITNYIAHPMQGAVSGDFLIQNDPKGKSIEFGNNKPYWISRLMLIRLFQLTLTCWGSVLTRRSSICL